MNRLYRTTHGYSYPMTLPGPSAALGREAGGFLRENRRLLVFTGLFLGGVVLGIFVYAVSRSLMAGELRTMLEVRALRGGFEEGLSALFSSCFSTVLLLALLFLAGLSACGAPLAAVVPLFYGLGLGLTEGFYYSTGIAGVAVSALLVTPHSLLAAAALVLGSMESVRMSLLFSRQLLPGGIMGGLWNDFKAYGLRFLIFLGLGLAAGVVDVLLRLAFSRFFL